MTHAVGDGMWTEGLHLQSWSSTQCPSVVLERYDWKVQLSLPQQERNDRVAFSQCRVGTLFSQLQSWGQHWIDGGVRGLMCLNKWSPMPGNCAWTSEVLCQGTTPLPWDQCDPIRPNASGKASALRFQLWRYAPQLLIGLSGWWYLI